MSLAITLKPGEYVNINGPATITYVRRNGNQMVLAFDCPDTTRIQRTNRPEKIHGEQLETYRLERLAKP